MTSPIENSLPISEKSGLLTPTSRWQSRSDAVQCVAEYMYYQGKRTFQSPKSCGGEVILLCTGSKNGGDCPVKIRIRRSKMKHALFQEWYIPQNGLILKHSPTCQSLPKTSRSKLVSTMLLELKDKSVFRSPLMTSSLLVGANRRDISENQISPISNSEPRSSPAISAASPMPSDMCMPTPPREYMSCHSDTDLVYTRLTRPSISKESSSSLRNSPPVYAAGKEHDYQPFPRSLSTENQGPPHGNPSVASYYSVFPKEQKNGIPLDRKRSRSQSECSRYEESTKNSDFIHPSDTVSKYKAMLEEIQQAKQDRFEGAMALLKEQPGLPVATRHAACRLLSQDDHFCIVFVTLDHNLRWQWLYRELNKRQIN